jgi:tight adherence protein C
MDTANLALGVSIFGLFMTIHLGVKSFLKRRQALEDSFHESDDSAYNPYDLSDIPISAQERYSNLALLQRLKPLAQFLQPGDQVELNELKQRLNYAGLRRNEQLELFNAVRSAVLLFSLLLIALIMIFNPMSKNIMLAVVSTFAGAYYLPLMWLNTKVTERQQAIQRSLPPTLDLLVTCMEAGLNLEGALDRVSKEMLVSDPELSEEFQVILRELSAGLSVSAAFKKFANRVKGDDLKNLSNVIIQSVTLGSSLGRALREYAATARRRREFKLEEEAGKVAAKLTLPLTVCLLPSSMIAMLAPAIVTISSALGR